MAHWAEVDENNIVIRVLVGDNEEPDQGYQWLIDNLGGRWIQTSYNSLGGVHYLPEGNRDENGERIPSGENHLRFNYAGIGYLYDPVRDAFIPPKPEIGDPSIWVLNEDTCLWELPESGA
jgi:hypothetical protein